MAGLYDIDIENCHYSILAQMAAAHGHQCTVINNYLDNKRQFREALAAEFGISMRQVKDALIALIYGAKFSVRAKDALPMIFNSKALAAKVAKQSPSSVTACTSVGMRPAHCRLGSWRTL